MTDNLSCIFNGLNDAQKSAVGCVEGPVLIVAGAGAGKTKVLTGRIAYILEKGYLPERILALTFTKKAANEMKTRIALLVGEKKARKLWMGTFHSVFIRFLREYADLISYKRDFTIYDTSDSVSAIKACIKELQLDEKVYKPKEVLSRISMAKNNLVTAEMYAMNTQAVQNDTARKKPRICDIYRLYDRKCRQSGVMDFDDILLNMNILLRDHPEAADAISAKFDFIMVDEYQDTNYSQYVILKKLSARHHNICVVGDDSQSIYAFRGAKIENILNFRKDYPDNRIFRLEQNYRSTQTIVNAANSLIAKNQSRIPKTCYSRGDEGEKIKLIKAYTAEEEALLITSSIISRLRSESAEYRDFAILYRTNSQSRAIEEALRRRNIPYIIYSGNSFFDRAEVKDVMAYFKLTANVDDDESFKRIVNKPARGIGDTSLSVLANAAQIKGTTLFRAACSDDLESFGLKPAAISKIRAFCDMILGFSRQLPVTDAGELSAKIAVESGIFGMYKEDNSIEGQSKAGNVEELLNSVKTFVEDRQNSYAEEMAVDMPDGTVISVSDLPVVTLGEFLEDISLLSAVDMGDDEDGDNKVALMTVHSSKGLEFPYVYVAGMEENLFPSGGMLASESDIEEERRLFYVAVTRAEKAVCLSFAATRMRNGKTESNSPSRFIREIDRQYIYNPLEDSSSDSYDRGEIFRSGIGSTGRELSRRGAGYDRQRPSVSHSPAFAPVSASASASGVRRVERRFRDASSRPVAPDPDFIPSSVLDMKAGQRVEHNRFGKGEIKEITGSSTDLKARILFDDHGEKILLLKYAKIRILSS